MKRTLSFSTPQRSTKDFSARGFTLIEIMVVLAIAAIVSAITLGGFKEMREGNKRVACQTNLTQIYQAARLYAADEGGKLPFYTNDCGAPAAVSGIGLWSLYTFPQSRASGDFSTIATVGSAPIERYLRTVKSLHCPSDSADGRNKLYQDDAKTIFDPNYLSYQVCDDGAKEPNLVSGQPTYSATRTTATNNSAGPWKRQLLHYDAANFVARQPTGDTVVTYCVFHRGQRNMDNVLFYDGSIQLRPNESAANNWKREPKEPQ